MRLAVGWIALLAACSQPAEAPGDRFVAARVVPDLGPSSAPVLLNDAITVYFTDPVDPMSVTRDSFAVLDGEGHPVRGSLRVDGSWVTFEPDPPLAPDLLDGSLLPAAEYRLVVTGYPRPEGIRSRRGRLLHETLQRTFWTAAVDAGHLGFPAPLRPVHADQRPFLLRQPEAGSSPLPADDPRLHLHFSLPLLPSSVTANAFDITLLRSAAAGSIEKVEARSVRVLGRQAVDEFAGCTVEIEFGSQVRRREDGGLVALQPDDFIGVSLVVGEDGVCDYAGRQPTGQVQWWYVVPGLAVTVAEWPAAVAGDRYLDADLATPGFEVVHGAIRPLLRIEAGDGHLGAFRPTRDTVLVPGQPFDRGDGEQVASRGDEFAFQSIDIPAGVTVQVHAPGPVAMTAIGRARIAGRLEIVGDAPPSAIRSGQLVDVSALRSAAALTMLAAGGIEVRGVVAGRPDAVGAPLALVTSGTLAIPGTIPAGSLLASEPGGLVALSAADRCVAVRVQLQPGLPAGTDCLCSGFTPFVALPADRGAGVLRLVDADPRIHVAWQLLPPNPLARSQPDFDPARAAPPRDFVDGDRIAAPPGSFLRVRCQVRVRGGDPLPRLRGIRALDRG